jgi:hypothetical protein
MKEIDNFDNYYKTVVYKYIVYMLKYRDMTQFIIYYTIFYYI